MATHDNGGAYAIKGFNYQKSVIALIAILHYLEEGFEIYVESEDDIVVSKNGQKTFIQAKSKAMSVAEILRRVDKKDSIIEKLLANGNEEDSKFKIVTTAFVKANQHLEEGAASILIDGATVYTFNKAGIDKINEAKLKFSEFKLKNSKIAITDFTADRKKALNNIKGIMVGQGIPMDRGAGLATLEELSEQIDQRSEIVIRNDEDYEKKKFTTTNLQNIFNHSRKLELFEELLTSLGYSVGKKVEVRMINAKIGATHETYIEQAKEVIRLLANTSNLSDQEIINLAIEGVAFGEDVLELEVETIALNAYCQVMYDKEKK